MPASRRYCPALHRWHSEASRLRWRRSPTVDQLAYKRLTLDLNAGVCWPLEPCPVGLVFVFRHVLLEPESKADQKYVQTRLANPYLAFAAMLMARSGHREQRSIRESRLRRICTISKPAEIREDPHHAVRTRRQSSGRRTISSSLKAGCSAGTLSRRGSDTSGPGSRYHAVAAASV